MKKSLWLAAISIASSWLLATPGFAIEKLSDGQMAAVRGGDNSGKYCETYTCTSSGTAKTCEYNAERVLCETIEPQEVWGCSAAATCHFYCFPKGTAGFCAKQQQWAANPDPQQKSCDCTQRPMVDNHEGEGLPDDCNDEYHTDCPNVA